MDQKILRPSRFLLIAAVAAAALAGCDRESGQQPPPVASAPAAPDTSEMGAGPFGRPPGCSVSTEEALQRINAARAAGRRCGSRAMPPAPPVQWNSALQSAAEVHSSDMARRNYFEHRSPDGVTVRQRVSASGPTRWKTVGENIAGGNKDLADAMQAWLESADHCDNLMSSEFTDVAVACAAHAGSEWGTYWTMVLGRK